MDNRSAIILLQRVTFQRKETPWLHWLKASYLMKGYDRDAIVQSAQDLPDGRAAYLGDLIAYPWRDPGPVPLKQRVGVSRSLGPKRRAIGVPGGFDYLLRDGEISLIPGSAPHTFFKSRPAFRSKYEDGIRDVRQLYRPDFYKRITGVAHSLPPSSRRADAERKGLRPLLELGNGGSCFRDHRKIADRSGGRR